jgi:hypothetical protein
MAAIHITDIEAAINHWRERAPSVDGYSLGPELRALAEVYGLHGVRARQEAIAESDFSSDAWAAWMAWYDTTPDTPCIAICSTSQGDAVCKGCGRTDEKCSAGPRWGPAKRHLAPHHRLKAPAWRFNRYAERALEKTATSVEHS